MRNREYEQMQAALKKAQSELAEARAENKRLQGVLEFIKRLFPDIPGLGREEDRYDVALRELLADIERKGEVTLPVQPPPDQPARERESRIIFKRVRKSK